ncbi:unnamed protein product [Moneuplotes crassus]|uniref:Uncharacterized protein n=1 Tax=Euplotes crassus TaxID=5936 RepID=A0AAD1Y232_EUPCR|nr:unnamed protein product [Moneuplotes crassus]
MINSLKSQTEFAHIDEAGYFFTRDTEVLFPGSVFEGAASNCITQDALTKDFSLFDSEERQACFSTAKHPEPPISTKASVGGDDLHDHQVGKLEADCNILCISKISEDPQRNKFKSAQNSEENKEDISCHQVNAQYASGSSCSSRRRTKTSSSGRSDVEFKAALRLIKRFFKNVFKSKNTEIIRRRYINCDMEEVQSQMKILLCEIFPQEELTEELVNYTIGVVNPKWGSRLDCSKEAHDEISKFHTCCQTFSKKKFSALLESQNFRVLCSYPTQKLDDPRIRVIKQELEQSST